MSGAHVISAYAGEDIILNCSVDSHIPPENIEEVSWRKMHEDILVLLYQEGEVLTESSHERYKDRVEFAEERNKGNFSLRLKDVRTEDKGLFVCLAFSGELSDNTTVEVQPLGKSLFFMHKIYKDIAELGAKFSQKWSALPLREQNWPCSLGGRVYSLSPVSHSMHTFTKMFF